ncbi:MAG: 3-phosphoshikimate 1-carboxyvinyltransferase [Gammaproteobacteria bacterium]
MRFLVQPGGRLRGRLRVPGDKSISHRALMFGAIARGRTRIDGLLAGEDVIATMRALQALGARIDFDSGANRVEIDGRGPDVLHAPVAMLDLGNSGTSIRLLTGLLAGMGIGASLTGDASLRRRPMRRVTEPLARMGAVIDCAAGGTPPVTIAPGHRLAGIDYTMPVASAQLKSALLLAGLSARGRTCITEPAATRDHTERMLRRFGVTVHVNGNRACVDGGATLAGADVSVPADISSAAFFLVGASIAEGSDVVLEHVGINPTRTGILDCLQAMGAAIQVRDARDWDREPTAELAVGSAPLRGIDVDPALVPRAIDEFPALAIAAACAGGRTRVSGAEELRVKESDRIAGTAAGLRAIGIDCEPTADGLIVQGGRIRGGVVDSHGDHRLAMAFAIAALRSAGPIEILDCANVATSFPGFVQAAAGLGLRIEVHAD